MCAYALTAMGFDMMVAEDGAHAQARASKARPDIIVMDVALRGNDGWTLLRDLKGDSRTREIPVVVITGYAAPSVRERAQREGCAAFCVKPFLPDALALRLRALLDRNVAHAG
jgi:two-component system cell cycle response regulator DivK